MADVATVVVIVGVVTFLLSITVVTGIVVMLPEGYFLEDHTPGYFLSHSHPIIQWGWFFLKNVIGLVLIVAGVVMIFTPGQGVLTILGGIFLVDFPGKRKLELALIKRPAVYSTINRVREKCHRAPLRLPSS